MKEFQKTKMGLFICEECNKTFKNKSGFAQHVNCFHNTKEYFDKWIKEESDGKCKICDKETEFTGFKRQYKNCCSKKCSIKYTQQQTENGCIKKYGVKSSLQVKDFKNKGKKTRKEKYGDENYRNNEKIKETCFKKYGVDNPAKAEEIKEKSKQIKKDKYGNENYNNLEKHRQTNLKKYGSEKYTNREKCKQTKKEKFGFEYYTNREKAKQTCLEKYGVEYASQNIEIYNKGLKTRFLIHKYKNTDLTYQGSYELDFLERQYPLFPDIQNAPSIKYKVTGKNKFYHPDFYIPSQNLIIEIKSSWTLKLDENIEEKKKATIADGFNYLMILDKDYSNL